MFASDSIKSDIILFELWYYTSDEDIPYNIGAVSVLLDRWWIQVSCQTEVASLVDQVVYNLLGLLPILLQVEVAGGWFDFGMCCWKLAGAWRHVSRF